MKSKDDKLREISIAEPRVNWRLLTSVCLAMILIGALAFWIGLSGDSAQRTWQAYLINFLFWSGLAYGAVLFAAVLNITKARWGRPIKRLAEAPGTFLPCSFLFFCGLYYGREKIFPWLHEPVEHKQWWLNVEFLFARDGLALFVLMVISLALIYCSVREDRKPGARRREDAPEKSTGKAGAAIPDYAPRGWRAQQVLSPILGILYALVLSLIAIDLIMSLDPHWVSTLFGAYYFIGSFYTALAALMILCIVARQHLGLEDYVQPRHMHDLGKLMLAFCLLTADFFYSQFLVIWYSDLPEETRYVILRVRQSPWEPLAWTVLFVCFAIPFVVLLNRKIKMKPRPMIVLSAAILIGMWLERLLLVAPSLSKGEGFPVGLLEIFITAGFFGTMGLCLILFFRIFPLLPISDPLLHEYLELNPAKHEA